MENETSGGGGNMTSMSTAEVQDSDRCTARIFVDADTKIDDGVHQPEEEYWPSMAAQSTTAQHQMHTLDFGCSNLVLKYKSLSSQAMTPLDMTYHSHAGEGETNDTMNEFYDGTGNLLWLAAVTLAHLLAYQVISLQKFLPNMLLSRQRTKSTETAAVRICELGCGTGGGGMAMILFHCIRERSGAAADVPNLQVVFTDNDAESLVLCRSNCELNGIDPNLYSQQLLWWGKEHLGNNHNDDDSNLQPHSFDTILATDVVYDLKLIRPLLETAYGLLKRDSKSFFVLSHVPRFCIPKMSVEEGYETTTDFEGECGVDNGADPFVALEEHIIAQARIVGLKFVETIRPAQELRHHIPADIGDLDRVNLDDVTTQKLTIRALNEAHAVVFIFIATDMEG